MSGPTNVAREAPGFLALEPDQARDQCINMVRRAVQFCVEIDPRLPGMKDVVIVSRSAMLENREGWTHLRQLATSIDDACQFVVNLLNNELTFQCNPKPQEGTGRMEWYFLVELRSDGRRG